MLTMKSPFEDYAMVQTTKYVTWRQLKAGMEIHGYKQEGRTCFLRNRHEAAVYENFKPFIEKLKK